MPILRATAFFLALAITLPSSECSATEGTRAPYVWIRTLDAVQDQIAKGSKAAHAYLPKLIDQIETEIAATPAATLLEPKNMRAIVAFSLSGGSGDGVEKLLEAGSLPPLYEKVARGARAYTSGRYGEASKYLKDVDARQLGAYLSGRVALVQAILAYKSDIKLANAMLDQARFFGIGTLVEEAALRRQIALEAALEAQDRFEMVAKTYFRKYSKAVYAPHFKIQFSISAATFDYTLDPSKVRRLEHVIGVLNEEDQLEVYTLLAEKSAFLGNVALTEFAADKALRIDPVAGDKNTAVKLYAAAAGVASRDPEVALEMLSKIPESELEAEQELLLHAAKSVAREVMKPAQEDLSEVAQLSHDSKNAVGGHEQAGEEPPQVQKAESTEVSKDADRILELAGKAISDANALISRKQK